MEARLELTLPSYKPPCLSFVHVNDYDEKPVSIPCSTKFLREFNFADGRIFFAGTNFLAGC